jgi:hypothetical protein
MAAAVHFSQVASVATKRPGYTPNLLFPGCLCTSGVQELLPSQACICTSLPAIPAFKARTMNARCTGELKKLSEKLRELKKGQPLKTSHPFTGCAPGEMTRAIALAPPGPPA